MKDIVEFISKLLTGRKLFDDFVAVSNSGDLSGWFKEKGFDVSPEDISKLIEKQPKPNPQSY